MAYNFQTGLTYSFSVYPDYLLSTSFTNVVILGTVNYEIASKYDDIYAMHAAVYGTLPTGTPNNAEAYDYLLVKTPTGNRTVCGIPWIKENTIIQVQANTAQVLIYGVSSNDLPAIRNALVQNGYNNIKIDLVN